MALMNLGAQQLDAQEESRDQQNWQRYRRHLDY
jgi:hypothetical protein